MKVQGEEPRTSPSRCEPGARDFKEVVHALRRVPMEPGRRVPAAARVVPEKPGPRLPQSAPPARAHVRAAGPGRIGAADASARQVAAPEQLRAARRGHDAESSRLTDVRAEAGAQLEVRGEERARDLLRQALRRELERPELPATRLMETTRVIREEREGQSSFATCPVGNGVVTGASASPGEPSAEAQRALTAEALLALVDRIEVFVRSQRPALALSLGQAFASRVELERTGPGEVAVTVVARGGVRSGDVERLREEVEARGLRLSRLVVAEDVAE